MRQLVIAATAALFCVGAASAYGQARYEGTVQTEWLGDGRHMRLLSPLVYFDPKGAEWLAPKDWIIDGASIPKFAWPIVGGPFEGLYRAASVIHDVACDQKQRDWEDVHEVFYNAMRTSGVGEAQALIMYAAVYYFGPRWPRRVQVSGVPRASLEAARTNAGMGTAPGTRVRIEDLRVNREAFGSWALESRPFGGGGLSRVEPNIDGRLRRDAPTPAGRSGDRFDATLVIEPPSPELSVADFELLKRTIEQRTSSGSMSLEEIRSFKK